MFLTIVFLAWQILKIVGLQLQIEGIFSLAGLFTNIKRCRLQTKNLEKLIFVSKNWPNDLRVGCKSPFNLVEFIEVDQDIEEELEQFKGNFEKDEVFEL